VVLHHLRAVWWSVSRATRQTVRVAVEPNIGLLLKWRFQIRRQDRTVVKRDLEVWLGEPHPLGATLTEEGVNLALYSEDATAVELCLFDSPEPDAGELRIPVTEQTDQTWHGPARTADTRRHFPSTSQRPVRAGTVRPAWPP